MNQKHFLPIVFGIIVLAFLRLGLLDYSNFAPIAAAGIFGLYFLNNKKLAIILALGALFLSDLVIQFQSGYGLYAGRIFDYLGLGLALVPAFFLLRKKRNFFTALISALAGSLIFFLVSNGAVWAFGTMYPKTATGLMTCYELGLPFYRGTFIGDLVFTSLFIGSVEIAQVFSGKLLRSAH